MLAVMPSPPRHERRDSPPRQTLPPISDLLKGPPDERSRHSPLPAHLAGLRRDDKQYFGPVPLPTPPAEDRRRDRDSYDGQPLPMRSGPPYDSSRVIPPPGGATPSSIYPPSRADSPYERAQRSNLPPPPPQQSQHSYQSSPTYPPGHPSYQQSPQRPDLHHTPGSYGPPHQQGPYHGQPPPGGAPTTPSYSHYHSGGSGQSYHGGSPMEFAGPSSSASDLGDPSDRPSRRRRGNLPKWATDYLKQWFFEHVAHPYPTEQEKQELCKITGLGMTQLSNWFINARRRQTPALQAQAQAENMIRQGSGSHHGESPDEGGPSPGGSQHPGYAGPPGPHHGPPGGGAGAYRQDERYLQQGHQYPPHGYSSSHGYR